MKLTRRITFSSGHRYWRDALDEEGNRKLFGKWASRYNHGHNYALEATVEGTINQLHGMVINIKLIDDLLKSKISHQFDQKSINDQVPYFQSTPPTLENLVQYMATQISELPSEVRLVNLRLIETERLWADLKLEGAERMTTITRSYEFSASHRLHAPGLSDAENIELFGKCNNPQGHGHNYILEVTVSEEINEKTGMMVDLAQLDAVVNTLVVDYLDHKNLNSDIPEFSDVNPTSEAVTQMIWNKLYGRLPAKLMKVRLRETARNSFEITR